MGTFAWNYYVHLWRFGCRSFLANRLSSRRNQERMMADNIVNPKYRTIKDAWLSAWNARGKIGLVEES